MARNREGAWHTIKNVATNLEQSEGEVCKLKRSFEQNLKCTVFHSNYTIYDVISVIFGCSEGILPTLVHNSSLDKHICGRVDCRCTWLARKATPRFRLKMTKINDFARAVARATKIESGISTDFWKAQTMLFNRCRNENFRTCLLKYVKTVSKLFFFGEKLRHL